MNKIQTCFFYMIVFFLTFILCSIFQKRIIDSKVRNKQFDILIYCIMIAIPLTFVSGIRSSIVGTDTKTYIQNFYYASNKNLTQIFNENPEDYLYNIVIYVFSHITEKPKAFLGFLQLCAVLPVLLIGIRKSNCINLCNVLAIYCFWHFNDSLNNIRQLVAIPLLILAVDYYEEKKRINALLLFLIAFGFHSSVIIVAPLLILICFIVRKNYTNIKKYCVICAIVLVFLFGQNIFILLVRNGFLSSRYNLYIDTFFYGKSRVANSWISVGLGGYFEILARIIPLVILVYISRKSKIEKIYSLYILLFSINILIYSIGILIYKTAYFVRLSLYFDYFGIILLPYLDLRSNIKLRIHKKNIYFFSAIYSIAYWFVHVYLLQQSGSIPYSIM